MGLRLRQGLYVPEPSQKSDFRLMTPLRVRYAECDLQGIVFNANYLAFADVGLTEYMRALMTEVSAKRAGVDAGAGMLQGFSAHFGGDNWVRHADVDFRAPARADDLLDVAVRITRFGRTSYQLLCHIYRGETLLNAITLTYVWFDPATEAVTPVAPRFIEAVTAYEKLPPERTDPSA